MKNFCTSQDVTATLFIFQSPRENVFHGICWTTYNLTDTKYYIAVQLAIKSLGVGCVIGTHAFSLEILDFILADCVSFLAVFCLIILSSSPKCCQNAHSVRVQKEETKLKKSGKTDRFYTEC